MTNAAITILQDRSELEWLADQRPQALSQTVLTFDLELHLELTRRGIDHLTPWDIAGQADRPRLERIEHAAHEIWKEHAIVQHRGINLLKIAAHRHISALSRMVWIGYVVEKAIELYKPECICVFDDTNAHGLEQPPHCRRLPLLSGIVQNEAQDRGIRCEMLSNPQRIGEAFKDEAASQAHRIVAATVDNLDLSDRPFVLLTGSGQDLLRQLPVVREIESTGDLEAVQVYRFADEATLTQLNASGHQVLHDSQLHAGSSHEFDASLCHRVRRDFELALTSPNDEAAQALQKWIPSSHLDFVFGTYAAKLVVQVDRWRAFFDRHQPEAIVSHYPDTAIEVAHRRGIQSVILQHGGLSIGDTAWYRSMPDVALGVSAAAHIQHLRAIGIDQRRIEVLDTHDDENVSTLDHSAREARRSDFEILLVTSRLADHAHDAELPGLHWKAAIESLEEIVAQAVRCDGWRFSIKTHPRYDHMGLYQNINDKLPHHRRINIITDQPLSKCAAAADAIVFANITSSSILEASRSNKPVVLLRDPSAVIHPNPRDRLLGDWPRLTSVAELVAHLQELATDDSFYEMEVSRTQQALADFHGPPAPSGSLLDFIRRKKKARVTDEGDPRPLVCFK
ncbi:MAG: hypothetical protein DHS20C16_16260 [Phycisphaerae bacterium]|nr:MAG: hypothetical protein DHS20C16_16260 [Phycisphaerae bacterium]